MTRASFNPPADLTSITLADGTVLPDCRPDLLNIGDLMARGWSIFPLLPRSKKPAVKWEQYQRRLATVDEIESWFTEPGCNVGIATGKISGIFVMDADSPAALAGC
jgi:Bifunctional DNA primase/polymerase, N-terminal